MVGDGPARLQVKFVPYYQPYLLSYSPTSVIKQCSIRAYAYTGYTQDVFTNKMPQRRDNAGAVCNSGMGMLFLCIYFSRFF